MNVWSVRVFEIVYVEARAWWFDERCVGLRSSLCNQDASNYELVAEN